jgi:hypothetical protein
MRQMDNQVPKWAFHKTRFAKVLSGHFDYKVERQTRGGG